MDVYQDVWKYPLGVVVYISYDLKNAGVLYVEREALQ